MLELSVRSIALHLRPLLMLEISLRRTEDQRRRYSRSEWYHLRLGAQSMATDRSLVLATQAIANVVKTSFGPSGLDKMMVDDIGVFYTLHLLQAPC
jgi:hypothetical protein